MNKTGVGLLVVLAMLAGGAVAGKQTCAGRISVSGDLQKKRDSSKKEGKNSSSRSKSESQHYDLKITAANTGKLEGAFDVEWYFFKRKLNARGDKGDPVLAEKGKKTVLLKGMKRQMIPVKSKVLKWSETTNTKTSSKKNSSSTSKKTISGDIYGGYLVILRVDGRILSRYSPDRKMTCDEWLGQMSIPLQ